MLLFILVNEGKILKKKKKVHKIEKKINISWQKVVEGLWSNTSTLANFLANDIYL